MEDKIYKKIFNSLDNSNFEDIFEWNNNMKITEASYNLEIKSASV